jgi:hypothetical protein
VTNYEYTFKELDEDHSTILETILNAIPDLIDESIDDYEEKYNVNPIDVSIHEVKIIITIKTLD